MECPYCKKEMTHGLIQSRNMLTWTEGNEIGAVRADAIQLSQPSLLVSTADAWYCPDCRTVIVPVPEIEGPLDKLGKKWAKMTARRQEAREERAAQRSEEKKEQEKEKRRKKDPWEMK